MDDPKQYRPCGNGRAWLLCARCWRIWPADDPRHDCRVPYARVAELEAALTEIGPYFIRDCARLVGLADNALPDAVMHSLKAAVQGRA